MFFQNPFPESILGGWSSQATLKNAILEQVLLPAGSKMSLLGGHFRPKGVKKVTTPNSTTPPGADLVAIWRRERPIKHFGTILDAILVPNGPDMWPLGRHFRPSGSQGRGPSNYLLRPGADLGATCDPKPSQDTSSEIWCRLWADLGPNFVRFWAHLGC